MTEITKMISENFDTTIANRVYGHINKDHSWSEWNNMERLNTNIM